VVVTLSLALLHPLVVVMAVLATPLQTLVQAALVAQLITLHPQAQQGLRVKEMPVEALEVLRPSILVALAGARVVLAIPALDL
jgi:hypothetical protein